MSIAEGYIATQKEQRVPHQLPDTESPRASENALLPLACLVLYAAKSWNVRWMSDDGLINIRVVTNLLAGHGPVFNAGERVEAYTSTLWVAILAFCGRLGWAPEAAAVYLGWCLACLGVFAAYAACVVDATDSPRERWSLPVGMLIFVSLPPFWDYATSGLEGGLQLCWMGTSYLMLRAFAAQPYTPGRYYRLAIWLSLGPLVRPECSLFSILIGALVGLGYAADRQGHFRLSRFLSFALCLGALPIGVQLFRMGYFGAIVPNTALAKEAFVSNWNQGGLFFSNFFQLYALLVPIGFVFVLKSELYLWLWRKKGLLHVLVYSAPTWVGLLYVLYIIKMGGGFMHGRMWMGPVFCLLLPVFVLPITRSSRLSRPWMWAGWAVVVMWSFIVVAFVRVAKENEYGIGDERGWYTRQATQRNPVFAYHYRTHSFYKNTQKDLAKWRKACEKGKTCPILLMTKHHSGKHLQLHPGFLPVRKGVVATQSKLLLIRGAVGIASVMAGQHIHIVDYLGLGSPLASRVRLGTKRGRPGHEKNLSHTWLIARFAKAHSHDPQALKYARKALTCKGSPLGAMLHGIRARLTWSRFWSNVRHSWEWSRLRIHAHPRKEDVHRLCKS